MKTIRILSLTLVMSIFYTGISFAHQQDQKGQKGKATSEERASRRIETMKKSLGLIPDQVTKLEAIQAKFAKDREQARTTAKNHRQDMKAKMEAYNTQVKSILTPEQYQKYQDQRKEMRKGGDKHGRWNKDNKDGSQQGKCNKDGNNHQGKWDKKKGNS